MNSDPTKNSNSPADLPSVDAVLALLDREVSPLDPVEIPLAEVLGCVLVDGVCADADYPACDRSSIDGYAVGAKDTGDSFELVGEILPGSEPPRCIEAGQALRVFTGSAVPPKAALVMIEDAEESGDRLKFRVAPSTDLIRWRGSSTHRGDLLLEASTVLTPGGIAVLASAGVTRPRVLQRPRVAHITTGREIVPADQPVTRWQIRDTNAPLLRALVDASGAVYSGHTHVGEAESALVDAVTVLPTFDVLLVSGGSSVGKYDNTAAALESLGFEVLVSRINVRPGKPLVIARRGAQWAFGLPGNPLSHFASFHLFVHRALARLARRAAPAFLEATFSGREPIPAHPRETFHPARINAGFAESVPWADSGDLSVLARTNGFLRVPAGRVLTPGSTVQVLGVLGG